MAAKGQQRRRRGGTVPALAAVWLGAVLAAVPVVAAEVAATVEWARRVALSTPVSGVVEAVPVQTGDAVEQGDVLVRLDPRPLEAAVRRARARVDRTRPARDEAKRELERSQQLYERTLLSKHDLQLAEIEYAAADAEHREAQAALDQARLDLEYSVVRAPFAGYVLERSAEVGQTVVTRLEARPLVTLAERGRLMARAEVAESAAAGLERDDEVAVMVDGRRYPGRVRSVGMEPVAGSEPPRYPVEVVFPYEAATPVRAGSEAKVILP